MTYLSELPETCETFWNIKDAWHVVEKAAAESRSRLAIAIFHVTGNADLAITQNPGRQITSLNCEWMEFGPHSIRVKLLLDVWIHLSNLEQARLYFHEKRGNDDPETEVNPSRREAFRFAAEVAARADLIAALFNAISDRNLVAPPKVSPPSEKAEQFLKELGLPYSPYCHTA